MISTALIFLKSNWRILLAAIALMPLVFMLGQCKGEKTERAKWEAVAAKTALVSEQAQRLADATRANLAEQDRARIAHNRQEIDHALASLPDSRTSARQHLRACIQLQRQDPTSSAVVAACGPAPAR